MKLLLLIIAFVNWLAVGAAAQISEKSATVKKENTAAKPETASGKTELYWSDTYKYLFRISSDWKKTPTQKKPLFTS